MPKTAKTSAKDAKIEKEELLDESLNEEFDESSVSNDVPEDDLSDEDLELNFAPTGAQIKDGEEYSYNMKIPKDRIAALIGTKGASKRELEEYCKARINIDSKEGDVVISGRDAIKLYELREIVKAISRGFSPEFALTLLKPDNMLEIINLKDYGADNKNKLLRIRSRVIGTGGKARRTIESLTYTNISVYGKTISILGEANEVANAKRALEMMITGSMHSSVYKWLEGQRRKARNDRQSSGF